MTTKNKEVSVEIEELEEQQVEAMYDWSNAVEIATDAEKKLTKIEVRLSELKALNSK